MGEAATEFLAPMLIHDQDRAASSSAERAPPASVAETGYRISFEQFVQILKESQVKSSANGLRGNYLTNRTLNFIKIKKPSSRQGDRHGSLPKIEESGSMTPVDEYQGNLSECWTRSLR